MKADCFKCQHGATCDGCGKRALPVHMPIHEAGFFCERCCPVCNPAPKVQAAGAAAEVQR